jgi:hypothetical protein
LEKRLRKRIKRGEITYRVTKRERKKEEEKVIKTSGMN